LKPENSSPQRVPRKTQQRAHSVTAASSPLDQLSLSRSLLASSPWLLEGQTCSNRLRTSKLTRHRYC
jgi:hypothetical protein